MPIPVRGVLVHSRSGTELSRVRTEFRLRLPEPSNKRPLESRGADIVMQSSPVLEPQMSGNGGGLNGSTQHKARSHLALKTKAKIARQGKTSRNAAPG
jgi:hypothetical protein